MQSGRLRDRYSSQVCYHEAGHAFACWYLGIAVHRVQVKREVVLRHTHYLATRDRKVHMDAAGISEPKAKFPDRSKGMLTNGTPKKRSACLYQIFNSLSGPLNTQSISGAELNMLLDGSDDNDAIDYCRAWAEVGPNAFSLIIARTKRILNLPQSRRAMWRIADRLSRDGSIWGHEVHQLCNAVFAGCPMRIRISN